MFYITQIPIIKTYLQTMKKFYAKPGSEYDECGAYRQCMTYVPMMKKVTMPSQVVAEVIFDPVAWSHVYD